MKKILSAQYYSLYLYSLIMLILPNIISYSQFAIILSVIATFFILRFIISYKKITVISFITIFVGTIIILLFLNDLFNPNYQVQLQKSFFLVVSGQTFPAVILTSLYVSKKNPENSENKLVFIYVVAFSFLVVMALLFPNNYTGGGGLTTDFILNYQNGSYLCAYISNYIILSLVIGSVEKKYTKILYIFLLFLVSFAMLAMGGKGGFVTYCFINSILVVYWMKKSGLSSTVIIRNMFLAILVVVVMLLIVNRVKDFSLGGSIGFERIEALLRSHNDSGRSVIYHRAIELISQKPFFGYGVGSVFGLLGTHSHNMLMDCLIETGFFGAAILILCLFNTLFKCYKLIKIDEESWFGILVFLQGFVIAMFSGYYLAQTLLFCGIVYIQGKYSLLKSKRVEY